MEVEKMLNLMKAWATEIEGGLPVEHGLQRYPILKTKFEYYTYLLSTLHKKEDAFISFYSYKEQQTQIIDRLFVDVDCEKPEEAWNSISFFSGIFYPYIRIFFSGSKGYHIYIYIKPTKYQELLQHKLRLKTVLSTWLQTPIDNHVLLDLKRIKRVVFTYNKGKYKIPITPNMTYKEIILNAEYPFRSQKLFSLCSKSIKYLDWKILLKSPHQLI
jgi:hypothetical protein